MRDTRSQCGLLDLAMALCRRGRVGLLASLAAFLLAVPTIRTGELNEVGSAKERVEDVAFMTRAVSLMRTAVHGRREAIVFTNSIQARLGRDQHCEPAAPSGHRLPNGLMAPMTC